MRYLYARDERQFPVVLRREYDRRARGANIHTQSRTLPHTSFPPVTLLYIYRRCLCMRCAYNKREGSEFSAMQHTGYWISLSCWWTHGTTNEQQIERIKKKITAHTNSLHAKMKNDGFFLLFRVILMVIIVCLRICP